MTLLDTHRLLAFDYWANKRILDGLAAILMLDPSDAPARLFSHILAAKEVWLARIQQLPYRGTTFWPNWDPATWEMRLEEIHGNWRQFLSEPDTDLTRYFSYTNSKGVLYETQIQDAVTHLTIHGQHHRAQIALHLRQRGYKPPATDFIYFTRDDAATADDPSA